MNTRHLTTIIVASSLMLPISALGGDNKDKRQHQQNAPAATSSATTGSSNWNEQNKQRISRSSQSAALQGAKRVDKDKLDSKLTAKELIGKEVVSMNGDRLGSVHDIGLAQVLPSEFRGMEEAASSSEFGAAAGSALRTAGMNNLNLYVAVGGVMGLGADIVSVPADQFGYDRENDRLTLNISEEQFTAIADDDADDSVTFRSTEGYASGAGATGTTGISSTDSSFGTTGTGLGATTDRNEVQKIQQALRNDSDLRNVASRINISESGNDILLTGEVTSEDQKDKVVEFVRDQTDKNVRDNLRVSSAAE